jgi:hypothetical protein
MERDGDSKRPAGAERAHQARRSFEAGAAGPARARWRPPADRRRMSAPGHAVLRLRAGSPTRCPQPPALGGVARPRSEPGRIAVRRGGMGIARQRVDARPVWARPRLATKPVPCAPRTPERRRSEPTAIAGTRLCSNDRVVDVLHATRRLSTATTMPESAAAVPPALECVEASLVDLTRAVEAMWREAKGVVPRAARPRRQPGAGRTAAASDPFHGRHRRHVRGQAQRRHRARRDRTAHHPALTVHGPSEGVWRRRWLSPARRAIPNVALHDHPGGRPNMMSLTPLHESLHGVCGAVALVLI